MTFALQSPSASGFQSTTFRLSLCNLREVCGFFVISQVSQAVLSIPLTIRFQVYRRIFQVSVLHQRLPCIDRIFVWKSEVASLAEVDVRTVLNIENYKGNPKFEVLCSIVRALNLETQEIFYPEMSRQSAPLTYLQQIIGECTDEEAEMLIQIVTAILTTLRSNNFQKVE